MATPENQLPATREFGPLDGFLTEGVDRRTLLKTAGALGALLAAGSCGVVRKPQDTLSARGQTDSRALPGEPLYFATSMAIGEEVVGLMVESHEGRPTKVEGNPEHPSSLGATHGKHQAWVLDLYDPDRLRHSSIGGQKADQAAALSFLKGVRSKFLATGGEGMAFILPQATSPAVLRTLTEIRRSFPKAAFATSEPLSLDRVFEGTALATGASSVPRVDFEVADVVVSLDCDFLGSEPDSVKASRSFAARRNPDHIRGMNRLYQIEPSMTNTGAMADSRIALAPSGVENFAIHLVRGLAKRKTDLVRLVPGLKSMALPAFADPRTEKVLSAVLGDLLSHEGTSAVVAGTGTSPAVHALVALINGVLGNFGRTVFLPVVPHRNHEIYRTSSIASLLDLRAKMAAGQVKTLITLGVDVAYQLGSSFHSELAKVPEIIALSSRKDHTAKRANHVIAQSHPLESWGDHESLDGVSSLSQPLLLPLGSTLSDLEVLLTLAGKQAEGRAAVLESTGLSETAFRKALQKGFWGSPGAMAVPGLRPVLLPDGFGNPKGAIELQITADPSLHDGRFANNSWLQELPNPISRHTWGNALWIPASLAKNLSVKDGDVVRGEFGAFAVEGPVYIAPGQAEGAVTATLGHGQTSVGRIGEGWGLFVPPAGLQIVSTAKMVSTGKHVDFASVQEHRSMEGRDLARTGTALDWLKKAGAHEGKGNGSHPTETLVTAFPNPDPNRQWAMVIDLGRCTGCSACLVSCQAENNIPAVGKVNVQKGREMHWIRIDRYIDGPADNPQVVSQPVACAQCEAAPCEQVCPVNATSHNREGLSDMTYNRCVGMRYCANNCPYKVRRFNFLDWHQEGPQSQKKEHQHLFDLFREPEKSVQMQFNPEVTVRMRGVMEKCTYCVQRIQEAKAVSAQTGKPIADGQIQTACSQSCPTGAISFGNLADRDSRVNRLRKNPRHYELLGELGIKPRTTYLGAVRNPHPDLA